MVRIAVWNANGLAQRSLEVSQFMVDHKINIMLMQHTHFTNKTFFKLNNYHVYCTNHPTGTARGGSAIIIEKSIQHELLHEYQSDHIQAANISLIDDAGLVVISALYSPPRQKGAV